ncbi:MAG: 5'-nucleotidase C-terminal domain-containing protein [Desulfovibrionaceae bacterium]|nr:5'-nucleotidase C-terminal domain-containing protein [Desulfovibrionaceae bacterium]
MAGRDASGFPCTDDAQCFGGYARIAYAIQKARDDGKNVLAVDAGDRFQGTLFYRQHGWPAIADCSALISYDAATLGNHEWDGGCAELAKYIGALRDTKTVIAANMTPRGSCPLVSSVPPPYIIREIGGHKVGVIGLANDEVVTVSNACRDTQFADRALSVRRAVRELEAKGVHRIVLVTHIGLPADRELARAVDGVDVIVGGHTHSYLGPGSKEGPYPIVEHSPSGQPVLVVTASKATQYIGELACNFDERGVLTAWSGQARELLPSAPRDPKVSARVAEYARSVRALLDQEIGRHTIDMGPDGLDACREGQCVSGMFMADAMLEFGRKYGAKIGLINGGAVRAALRPGTITAGDILTCFPFEDKIVLRDYTGAQLSEALEHGLAEERACGPRILQPSGLRYEIDSEKPVGQRLRSVVYVDAQGKTSPLRPKKVYRVALTSYLAEGGDSFAMLKKGRVVPCKELTDAEVITNYFKKHKPATLKETRRILRK